MPSSPRGLGEDAGRYTAVQRCSARTWHTGCSTCNRKEGKVDPRLEQKNPSLLWALPWDWNPSHLLVTRQVEEIVKIFVASSQEGPHRAGAFGNVVHLSLAGAISKEGTIKARVCVLYQLHL